MEHKNSINKPFWRNSLILILLFSVIGVITGFLGFKIEEHKDIGDSLYTTIQLFVLHHSFDGPTDWFLQISRWSIFVVVILLSKDVLSILFREQLKFLKITFCYRNHIIFCGLTEQSLLLAKKLAEQNSDKQMIFIDNNANNPLHRSLYNLNASLITGDPNSETILKLANIHKAKKVFVFTGNDEQNVENAKSIFTLLKMNFQDRTTPLKCYVLIKDRELKNILEETALFKYTVKENERFFFDGILLNMNEIGIKYGICMNIDKILPENKKLEDVPEFLIVGLTDKAREVILNLAHCLTMKRESFRFIVVEKNKETISDFNVKCSYLQDFAKIDYTDNLNEICENKAFTSVFVCAENQAEALKTAIFVRNIIADNRPNIFIFPEKSESFNEIFNVEGYKILPLKNRNIFLINTLEEAMQYVIKLNPEIEILAEMAHNLWRKKDEKGNYADKDEYCTISGHFKQTNRNQVLDNYLRTLIATGKRFDAPRQGSLVSFSDQDRETLAMIEHRRWMIEKYINGWRKCEKGRKDEFKIHNCLKMWNDNLPEDEKIKDYKAIDLMINCLNKQFV